MLEYYKHVNNYYVNVEAPPLLTPGVDTPNNILEDAMNITLSEYSPKTKEFITAHKIKDYRKKNHMLVYLIPDIDIVFDRILEGSDYYSKLLSI